MWKWINKWWKPKSGALTTLPKRRIVDTNSIRVRISGLGWNLLEIPIRRRNKADVVYIAEWKLVASRGYQSFQTSGENIDEAMKNIGKMLGVIPRDMP
jgi:hypothetical protein